MAIESSTGYMKGGYQEKNKMKSEQSMLGYEKMQREGNYARRKSG